MIARLYSTSIFKCSRLVEKSPIFIRELQDRPRTEAQQLPGTPLSRIQRLLRAAGTAEALPPPASSTAIPSQGCPASLKVGAVSTAAAVHP